ncbi:sensor histidine kinase [Streptomyces mexicanus]|uniref:sensor histidine kinase n=1 Tax=Streptomyces mexicanus TaxID=178566 RepID=UPI00135B7D65|nr:nitrate- and nitrite sensing domain-containing protein [Streptomyces mexicanus]
MRAPVQKKRPRRTGKQTATAGGPERTPGTPSAAPAPAVGKGRPTHVRNRLVIAVAVVAAAVAGAGAPAVIGASGQLSDSQDLVTLAGQTQDALALAHSLADERDEVTSYLAAGRPKSQAPSEQRSTRVDRQVEELRANTDTPAWLRKDLDGIAAVRRAALTGQSSALQAHQAYSATIADLHRLAEQLAEQMPARAGSGAHALADLDTAVQQAAAARGLLLAALNVPHTTQTVIDPVTGLPTQQAGSSKSDADQRDALSAAAQQARVRSDAALAQFRETAPEAVRASYDSTVTGPEADAAEKYLDRLTARPELSDSDLNTSTKKLDTALTARIDLMRGAESSLYDHRTKDLAKLRDDDVTALELRIAVLGAVLLVALGVCTALARTLTRPLAVLRLGSARLAGAADAAAEEPIRFTGRNDEFAQVVRSVNTLHAQAVAPAERVATPEADRKPLVGPRQKMADAREELRAELAESTAELRRLRASIGSTFVNLALRTLGLVERQLGVIEGLEDREQDPDRLATLFKLDHFATVMRRHNENLLVLAGTEHVQQHAGPVPLVDVVRAAVSEIERYERVRIAALPPHAHVAGFAADDLSHLLAELMENATSFSPPDQPVEVSGWLLENGEIMLSVQDEGIGMAGDRMARLNARLADFDPDAPYDQEGEDGLGLGLYVVARLAHRHGVRVQLREQKQGGTAAVVVVPQQVLAAAPASAVPAPAGPGPGSTQTQTFSLPGANAEVNSNVLHARAHDGDPLVALAEKAVRQSEAAGQAAATGERGAPEETAVSGERAATGEAAVSGETEPSGGSRAFEDSVARGNPVATEETSVPGGRAAPEERPVSEGQPASEERAVPAESPAETTMELLLPSQAKRPAGREAADGGATGAYGTPAGHATEAEPETDTEHARAPEEQVTAKGLPKRTPKITAPAQAPRRRTGSVDAEALRRRLGGFRKGAQAGYRDVEAEIAERTAQTRRPAPITPAGHPSADEATGGTVEEASS